MSGSTDALFSIFFPPQQASCPYLDWALHKSIAHVLLPRTRRTEKLVIVSCPNPEKAAGGQKLLANGFNKRSVPCSKVLGR